MCKIWPYHPQKTVYRLVLTTQKVISNHLLYHPVTYLPKSGMISKKLFSYITGLVQQTVQIVVRLGLTQSNLIRYVYNRLFVFFFIMNKSLTS